MDDSITGYLGIVLGWDGAMLFPYVMCIFLRSTVTEPAPAVVSLSYYCFIVF